MNHLGRVSAFGFGAFLLLQFVRPSIPETHAEAEFDAPAPVRQVFEKDCYSCHSNQRRLAWFDEIVPAYWLVRRDVLAARQRLNFSTLSRRPAAMQKAALYEAVNMMQLGAMPLAQFRMLHPEAKVTDDDLATLKRYLDPWKDPYPQAAATTVSTQARVLKQNPMPEFNGLAFDAGYRNWKALSFTDRGDNNTFRFILGNDIALRAVRSGQMTPWPDGAKIAKVAWQKTTGPDRLVYFGNFVQVELMEKNARRYKATDGWGWGRWRGQDLKPYGKDVHFAEECTGCHLPVRGNDSVYTLPITNASVVGKEIVNNRASLPASLPYQPLDWIPSTMYADPAHFTTAVLFVNDSAQQPSSSTVLALVTWSQREDPHWFGARVPDQPKSVEFLKWAEPADGYSRYAGPDWKAVPLADDAVRERVRFIRSLTRAKLP